MNKLKLDITTPEALISSSEVDMVNIPGEEGDFGVLVDHAPLISTLRPGAIIVYNNDNVIARYFVTGGFVEVNQDSCNILATKIEDMSKLTADSIEKRIKNLEKHLRHPDDEFDKARTQEELELANVLKEVFVEK